MIIRKLTQGLPEWLEWRKQGIGGSDAATILGVSPFEDATVENLFREKVEGWERPVNFAMRQGTRLEPTARLAYQRWASCVAPPVCVEHPDAPWMRVSLDGLCTNHAAIAAEREQWVLELKVPGWEAHSWALAGEVPDYYRPQCQWQLLCTGLDRLDYASFCRHSRYAGEGLGKTPTHDELMDRLAKCPDMFAVVRVEPDPEMQGELIEKCEAFWLEVCRRRGQLAANGGRSPQAVAV